MINIINTSIEDVKIIEPSVYSDKRGYFFESYNQTEFNKVFDDIDFIQDNESKSSYGVLRGLHFQKPPFDQSKLVRVISGEIQDVAVDIRKESETYLKYVSVILNEHNKRQLFIPKGFAHGFLVLSKEAIVSYKVDNFFSDADSGGIFYNDKQININWKIENSQLILSDKDKKLPNADNFLDT